MTDRSYTVKEIDALRGVCRSKVIFGRYNIESAPNVRRPCASYGGWSGVSAAEEMVRTHMLAGHTAEDLIASEKEEG